MLPDSVGHQAHRGNISKSIDAVLSCYSYYYIVCGDVTGDTGAHLWLVWLCCGRTSSGAVVCGWCGGAIGSEGMDGDEGVVKMEMVVVMEMLMVAMVALMMEMVVMRWWWGGGGMWYVVVVVVVVG